MPSAGSVELTVEQQGLQQLGRRLAAEDGGKLLRLELMRNLRTAVQPAVDEIKGTAMSTKREASVAKPLSKYKGPEADVSLGAAIARGVTTQVRMSGRATGVSVKAKKTGMPRKFVNAPKRFNAAKFRHMVFGNRGVWRDQVGMPGFFDKPLRAGRAAYRVAIVTAMEEMGRRLAGRA